MPHCVLIHKPDAGEPQEGCQVAKDLGRGKEREGEGKRGREREGGREGDGGMKEGYRGGRKKRGGKGNQSEDYASPLQAACTYQRDG